MKRPVYGNRCLLPFLKNQSNIIFSRRADKSFKDFGHLNIKRSTFMEKDAGFWSGAGNTFEDSFGVKPHASRVVPAELLNFRAMPMYR